MAVNGFGGALDRVRDPVELGAVPSAPQLVHRMGFTRWGVRHQRSRHHGIGAARAGETGGFGKTSKFNGHLPSALDFENGVGQGLIPDKGFVSGIVQYNGPVGRGVIHPSLELIAGDGRTGGVVGKTQVDQIHRFRGQIGDKSILGVAVEIDNARVTPIAALPGSAGHHIGVQVNRIDRIGNGDAGVGVENFLDVGGVALGAVADEDLIGMDVGTPGLKVVGSNGLS